MAASGQELFLLACAYVKHSSHPGFGREATGQELKGGNPRSERIRGFAVRTSHERMPPKIGRSSRSQKLKDPSRPEVRSRRMHPAEEGSCTGGLLSSPSSARERGWESQRCRLSTAEQPAGPRKKPWMRVRRKPKMSLIGVKNSHGYLRAPLRATGTESESPPRNRA